MRRYIFHLQIKPNVWVCFKSPPTHSKKCDQIAVPLDSLLTFAPFHSLHIYMLTYLSPVSVYCYNIERNKVFHCSILPSWRFKWLAHLNGIQLLSQEVTAQLHLSNHIRARTNISGVRISGSIDTDSMFATLLFFSMTDWIYQKLSDTFLEISTQGANNVCVYHVSKEIKRWEDLLVGRIWALVTKKVSLGV